MTASELAVDGKVIARTLAAPALGLGSAVERRRSLAAIAVATLAALAFAAVAVPRVDYDRAAAADLARSPKAAQMTPHDREEAIATARKLGQIAGWAGAIAGPALQALGAATALFLAFRVAGTRPAFRETFAVASHGLLPVWLARLLAIPAALARAPIPAEQAGALLPSSPAALLPPGAPPAVAGALGGLDLFAIWAIVLVATGMAKASGASRRRAAVVTVVLYVAWVAVARIALPAALAAAPGPGGPR
ncbi:MAG TPA: YIP1 family protein [Anaeromyxobacter sp.]|nr:YIP1 family protein [Anaeromyxobacter sp.]